MAVAAFATGVAATSAVRSPSAPPADTTAAAPAPPASTPFLLSTEPGARRQQLWSRRQERVTERALDRLSEIAENFDFTGDELDEMDELLARERVDVIRVLAAARAKGELATGLSAVENIREDTDNQVKTLLGGDKLQAYEEMRSLDDSRRLD